ncbi:HigA family addiction module antitoxin [Pleomorphovibrio marinus]|jgi:antitoxin HigA-1|uniref:HigA family addiction module antitoxin n=1 Tax=Pleomorphovibrio marinus TaxID=2164132 RepID=UPI000E0B01DD|nr:HigA family addiction module antitoxin [Pleomorphovibrio marinus]
MKRGIEHNTHPGEVLKEEVIRANRLTIGKAAELLGVTRPTLSNILNEKASITPNMSLRLAKVFGGNADFWLRMQLSHDLRKAEKQFKENPPKIKQFESQ